MPSNLITNGNFATGNFTGWTTNNGTNQFIAVEASPYTITSGPDNAKVVTSPSGASFIALVGAPSTSYASGAATCYMQQSIAIPSLVAGMDTFVAWNCWQAGHDSIGFDQQRFEVYDSGGTTLQRQLVYICGNTGSANNQWRTYKIGLNNWAGTTITLRWSLKDDGAADPTYWFIDNVQCSQQTIGVTAYDYGNLTQGLVLMDGYDSGLGQRVRWNSVGIDGSAAQYTGTGPLSDITYRILK